MADLRLNGVIRALEAGRPAFTCFSVPEVDSAYAMAVSKFDGVVFEMEHNPWDGRALRDSLQYMLNRGQIVKAGNVAPAVTPMVRIPVNGVEKAQWQAKSGDKAGAMKTAQAAIAKAGPKDAEEVQEIRKQIATWK